MIRRIAVALVFGLLTTIAVAFGLTLAFDPAAGKITGSARWCAGTATPGVQRTDWWIWIFEGPGTLMVQRASGPSSATVWSSFTPMDFDIPAWSDANRVGWGSNRFRGTYVEDGRGWPAICLVSRWQVGQYAAPTTRIIAMPTAGIHLPWQPVWSGLLVDTALYTACWFTILFVPGMFWRTLRGRRGVCLHCGYDLRGAAHAKCPECGEHAGKTLANSA